MRRGYTAAIEHQRSKTEDIAVPADAPPLFIAFANDDELAVEPGLALYSAWRAADHAVELHIYAQEVTASA